MKETCDTCKWCEFRKYLNTGTIELYCENELSEKYKEPIRLNDTCDEWEEKEMTRECYNCSAKDYCQRYFSKSTDSCDNIREMYRKRTMERMFEELAEGKQK